MSAPQRLSVSLVTYHSPMDLLAETVDSLHRAYLYAREQGIPLELDLQVIDNSSLDSYRARLQQRLETKWQPMFDRVGYRCSGRNLGYGAAHNLGIVEADSDHHLVLNPDVQLAEDALLLGQEFLTANPDVAMINPRATNSVGVPQYLCKRYPSILVMLLRAFAPLFLRRRLNHYMAAYELRELRGPSRTVDVPLMSGCCMYARTRMLQQVGGFCDDFFLYFEDFDLSMRLLPLGRLVFLPDMCIVHHGGYSARKGLRHILLFAHAGWKFYRRHGWCWI